MKFTSTRNKNESVGFAQAVLNCMPKDGGLYVPYETDDLRRWITFMDENTSFASIAGSLTSAFIKDEFSPIICETIATKAFKFSPEIKQLDEKLFLLEIYHGPTGMHRDFGVSYLVSCLETILQLRGGNAVFLDVSNGELGSSLAFALRGKKNLKAVVVAPKGCTRGMNEEDFVWNGGNIYPVEVDGSEFLCHFFVKRIFSDRTFVNQMHLTVANTANIGRLLPQAFFYPFAFSRIKNKVHCDINYALAPGNYSNLVAGLYAWQFALPLNGFVIPSTSSLGVDALGNPILLDSIIPLSERESSDPSEPSNLERLEEIFSTNELMMRHFIYPKHITEEDVDNAAKELFLKYKVLADKHTSRAYAATLTREVSREEKDDSATVLIARDDPALSADFVRHTVGEVPQMKESIAQSLLPIKKALPCIKTLEELRAIIERL